MHIKKYIDLSSHLTYSAPAHLEEAQAGLTCVVELLMTASGTSPRTPLPPPSCPPHHPHPILSDSRGGAEGVPHL